MASPACWTNGDTLPIDETMVAKQAKPSEANIELHAQVDRALKAGIMLSHLDTHMTALVALARSLSRLPEHWLRSQENI